MPFSPTDVSGCFAWFKADSIGLTQSGQYVTYWQDLSGSGNNVTYPTSPGSSTTVFPIYIPNVLNGYPAVRFSGGQYLTTNSVLSANTTNTDNWTSFVVYASTGLSQQIIFSVDQGNIATAIGGIVGVDTTGSGYFFVGNTSTNPVQSSVYNPGSYLLRHDRFDPVTTDFYFGYFGKDIGSGVGALNNLTTNIFNIGHAPKSTYSSQNFQGDILELIVYRQPLVSTDLASVNNYLNNKYFPPPSAVPIPFKLPSDLSGLFCWYRSTSIGITGNDGSPVQYWPDDSTSGNYLYVNPSQSSSWVFPQFYRNQINGYPVVRFINGSYYSYLQTDVNHSSIILDKNDISLFGVFTPSDNITDQAIYGIDDGLSNSYCYVGLNKNYNNSFYFATGSTLNFNVVTASSTTFGTTLYNAGSFMIRSDRFKPATSGIRFGRYAAELASGYINTNNVNSPIFRVAYNSAAGLAYYGDIAEIVGYNRSLSDYETELVNDYLINKYMPGNVGSISMFLYGDTPSGIYKSVPIYTSGNAYTTNISTTLYTGSSLLQISGMTLYSESTGSINSGFPLYMAGGLQISPLVTLYLFNTNQSSSGKPLYIGSSQFTSNNTTIYMSGGPGISNSNITLYTESSNIYSSGVKLYTYGKDTYSSGTTLYIPGSLQAWPPIYLYTYGVSSGINSPNNISLYMTGWSPPASTLYSPLYTYASNPGVTNLYKATPLYLEGGKVYQSMPLYIGVEPIPYPPSGAMPLFIGDPYATGYYYNNLSLFVGNYVSQANSIVKRLYTIGAGGLAGGSIENSPELPLYLFNNTNTPPPSSNPAQTNAYFYNNFSYPGYFQVDYFDIIPTSGNSSSVVNMQNSTSLYIGGASTTSNDTTLYQKGSLATSGIIDLYIFGGNPNLNNNIVIYTRGF